jgi:hypothetical protein
LRKELITLKMEKLRVSNLITKQMNVDRIPGLNFYLLPNFRHNEFWGPPQVAFCDSGTDLLPFQGLHPCWLSLQLTQNPMPAQITPVRLNLNQACSCKSTLTRGSGKLRSENKMHSILQPFVKQTASM